MKITSEIKRYKGFVELPDFLNIKQVRAFEEAYFGDINAVEEEGKRVWVSVSDERLLPVILDIVTEWHLEGVPEKPTVDTLPMTPQADGHALISWIAGELYKLWRGEQVPND